MPRRSSHLLPQGPAVRILASMLATTMIMTSIATAELTAPRTKATLSTGWLFHTGGAKTLPSNASAWRPVNVPHDFVIEGTFEVCAVTCNWKHKRAQPVNH